MGSSPECSPLQMIDAAVAALHHRAETAGIALQCDFHFPVPELIPVSGEHLSHLLTMLLVIAVESAESDRICVTLSPIKEADLVSGLDLRIEFQARLSIEELNNAIGQPPPKAWYDLTSLRNRQAPARAPTELARSLGGRLDTTGGSGSRIGFSFVWKDVRHWPETEQDSVDTAESAAAGSTARGSKAGDPAQQTASVLLADDQPDLLQLIRIFMARHGVAIDEAPDGQAAVDKALASRNAGTPYRLIVVDLRMPKLDGFEVVRLLRKLGWSASILGTSAFVSDKIRSNGLEAGFDDILQKPTQPEVLCSELLKYLGQGSGSESKAEGSRAKPGKPPPESAAGPETAADSAAPFSIMQSKALTDEQKAELMEAFLDGLAERADRLSEALGEQDRAALIELLHALKGAAGVYGVDDLRTATLEIEGLARKEAGWNELDAPVRRIVARCRELEEQRHD